MAIHEILDSPDDVPVHVDHKPQPVIHSRDNEHDVFDVARHLTSSTGEKGASVAEELAHHANKQHDDSGHFSAHYTAMQPGHDKPGQDDPSPHSRKMDAAEREVHENVPKNVMKTGKTGKAKEAMLQAIAYSKAGEK